MESVRVLRNGEQIGQGKVGAGGAKARAAPVDPTHIPRWRGPIATHRADRQPELLGLVVAALQLVVGEGQ